MNLPSEIKLHILSYIDGNDIHLANQFLGVSDEYIVDQLKGLGMEPLSLLQLYYSDTRKSILLAQYYATELSDKLDTTFHKWIIYPGTEPNSMYVEIYRMNSHLEITEICARIPGIIPLSTDMISTIFVIKFVDNDFANEVFKTMLLSKIVQI